MKMKTLIMITGAAGLLYFLLTRRSRPKPAGDRSLSGVFKGIAEEISKPLNEIADKVPGS